MSLINEGSVGHTNTPWSDQRVFIFRVPPAVFRKYRSTHGQAGRGRIWMRENGPCAEKASNQFCPMVTSDESVCLDSSLPFCQSKKKTFCFEIFIFLTCNSWMSLSKKIVFIKVFYIFKCSKRFNGDKSYDNPSRGCHRRFEQYY